MGCQEQIKQAPHLFLSLVLFSLFACQNKPKSFPAEIETEPAENLIHYSIESRDNYQILSVHSPFVNGEFTERYVFYPRGSKAPELDSIVHYIATPIRSMVISSTTHVGFLQAIDGYDQVLAASNIDLIYDSSFRQRVDSGKIASLGIRNVNQESLIAQNADVVLGYAIDMAGYQQIKRWRELGQSVLLISEFMERDPIHKASWLHPISLLLDKEKEALEFLFQLKSNYDSLKSLAQSQQNQPTVLMGFPWKGTWYMSGGKSFQAQLFEDAGANYLWKDKARESGMPLSIEEVISKGLEADYWLNLNAMTSLQQMKEADERFTAFSAYKNARVYNNNKRLNEKAGNDYWESGVVRPDLVLKDLIQIFHPNLIEDKEFTYYQALK